MIVYTAEGGRDIKVVLTDTGRILIEGSSDRIAVDSVDQLTAALYTIQAERTLREREARKVKKT